MFIRDDRVFYSASDLKAAVECEWALMRKLDAKLGRIEMIEDAEDAMLARASELGDTHEQWALQRYRDELGEGVVEIDTEDARAEPVVLARKHEETIAALKAGAPLVFQATFLDEPAGSRIGFVGFADFLVRDEHGAYEVWDTKLARKARVTALLQLAAYGDQLRKAGIPVADNATLLLGNRERSDHRLSEIEPAFHDRVARLTQMIEARLDDENPLPWGAPGYTACGRCEWCTPKVERTRDVLLVAGMRTTQRHRFAEAGIHTVDDLAHSPRTAPDEAYAFGCPALRRIAPKMIVPTKSTIPMMASQSSPSKTNPTTERMTHATSKMIRTVHMLPTLRGRPMRRAGWRGCLVESTVHARSGGRRGAVGRRRQSCYVVMVIHDDRLFDLGLCKVDARLPEAKESQTFPPGITPEPSLARAT